MVAVNAAYWRDANHVPITYNGLDVRKQVTINGSSATVNVPLFTITGVVQVVALYGIVTTNLGTNHTAAYWRLQDQTAQVDITLNTGTTLSSAKAGSIIAKKGLAAAALTKVDSVAGAISEPTTLETTYFSPFVMAQKTTSIKTEIEYVYTTNQATVGVIEFHVGFIPLSSDGDISVSATAAY